MLVSELFKRVSSDTKGQSVSPTVGTTEWYQWLDWSNEELGSYSEVHDWKENADPAYPSTLNDAGIADLPSRFKKMAGAPIVSGEFYTEVDFDQFNQYASDQKVFRIIYDEIPKIEFKGSFESGTSVVVPFIGNHSSLATTTDTIYMRNPVYLVKRLKERVFKYRQDPIFTEVAAEADLLLQQMLENEYYKHSQYRGGATTVEEEQGFTLGID